MCEKSGREKDLVQNWSLERWSLDQDDLVDYQN